MAVSCDIVDENIKLYKNILFPPKLELNSTASPTDVILSELNIEIANSMCPSYPNSTMDESCITFKELNKKIINIKIFTFKYFR